MDLSGITIESGDGGGESLAAAVQAVLRWGGLEMDECTLTARLGGCFLVAVPRDRETPGGGETLARDWNLLPAARLVGLELRPLHPPVAARGLADAEAFAQPFLDSYAPLIRDALDHGQPVLVWQGWPEDLIRQWGIIIASGREGLGLSGVVLRGDEELLPLTAPAVQCYVVESVSGGHKPSVVEVARFAVAAAETALHDRIDTSFGVVSGPAAYEAWLGWLLQKDTAFVDAAAAAILVARLARTVTNARRLAQGYLELSRDRLDAAVHPALDETVERLRSVIAALSVRRVATGNEGLVRTESGRRVLAADIRAAQHAEGAVAEALRQLRTQLGS